MNNCSRNSKLNDKVFSPDSHTNYEERNSKRPNSLIILPPEFLASCDNLIKLPYLYEESVLECIIKRFEDQQIYTWAGPILVAVNPVKPLKHLYSSNRINHIHQLLKEGKDYKEPHVFTVAGLAHRRLVSEIGLVNQAILVSGESGAGKTESTKYLLKYLTQVNGKCDVGLREAANCAEQTNCDIESKILASNPVLEAFGNAATLRNHNSSRFGKFIRLLYNGHKLEGSEIETYLLEKTRLTKQPRHEKNFHIFYQFLSAIRCGLWSDSEVINWSVPSFSITPGFSGRRENETLAFEETLSALKEIGVSHDDQLQIFRLIMVILCLGNVSFEKKSSQEIFSFKTDDRVSSECSSKAAHLLGLSKDNLEEVFTRRKIVVKTRDELSTFSKGFERVEECEARRDSMMQLLYVNLFAYVVSLFNAASAIPPSRNRAYLGILDIYGFEAFQDNSLEQLCINYTNERLQQEFAKRFVAAENEVMIEEGFVDLPFAYNDNLECLVALDSKISVFAILNEECQLRRTLKESDACERICNTLESTGVVSPLGRRRDGFLVKHYAGQVPYRSSGLLRKNKDEISEDIISLLSISDNQFIVNLADLGTKGDLFNKTSRKSIRMTTTLSKFKGSLDSLIKVLSDCDLHFVRCLKPNLNCSEAIPDYPFLLDQLRSNGVLETVKISQAGFPVRMLYSEFVKRYNMNSCGETTNEETSTVILRKALNCSDDESLPLKKCRLGKKRVFLSENSLHLLEETREKRRNEAAVIIQKHCKGYLQLKRFKINLNRIFLLQRTTRGWLCKKRYMSVRKSILIVQKYTRRFLARKIFLKKLHSVIVLQKYIRGWICRRQWLLKKSTMGNHLNERPHSISMMGDNSAVPESTPSVYNVNHSPNMVREAPSAFAASRTTRSFLDTATTRPFLENATTRPFMETATTRPFMETATTRPFMETVTTRPFMETATTRPLMETATTRPFMETATTRSFLETATTRPFLETEESGIETDTESLSGDGYKAGRSWRLRTRGSFHRPNFRDSDDDVSDSIPFRNTLPLFTSKQGQFKTDKSPISKPLRTTMNINQTRDLEMVKNRDFTSQRNEVIHFTFQDKSTLLYYKNGILSLRRLSKGAIKFHTKPTCLAYSTSIPYYEIPKGLPDLLI